jgi:hypothetical protein
MTLVELEAKWRVRLEEWRRLGVSVNGEKLAEELLGDLEALERSAALGVLTLNEAHELGGYSVDHLQRMVATGQLENVGRKHRPRIRLRDVPVKPGHALPNAPDASHFSVRRRIVDSVLTGDQP